MPEIRQLSTSVINKIAAGEVIERPASIVKELLENAVDAGASRIEVALGQGGSEYVRVSDNGCGIHPDQLTLAVASHATSKIRDADDLFHVATLGFRGEALASISEVSRFLIRSREADSAAGAQLEVIGGQASAIEPCGCGPGTTIEVRDLFFNTPVRRKFLRAAATETGHATEAFTRVALGSPEVHFVFKHNDRVLYDLPPTASWRERIAAFFGREIGQGLIATDGIDNDLRLSGYVGDPQISRPNNRLQYLFLNGRCIRDRSLQHALGEAYRGLLLTGRFPIAFLRLEMPAELIDVNVHPTKLEVRFQDSGRIYSHLLGTIRRKFLGTDLTARVAPLAPESATGPTATGPTATMTGPYGAANGSAAGTAERVDQPATGPAPNSAPAWPWPAAWSASGSRGEDAHDAQETARRRAELVAWAQGRLPLGPATAPRPDDAAASAPSTGPSVAADDTPPWRLDPAHLPSSNSTSALSGCDAGMQLHNRYLVTENEEGILVIDQHALHERVLYEQLREKVLSGRSETQRLLVPEPIALTPAEAGVLLEAREALDRLGIAIEPFGGGTILVTSYPAMLANLGPAELVRQVLERLLAGGKTIDRRDLVDELLHMISCKAAIKAGDRLAPAEVHALLAQRHLFQDTHHCPHGRPTALVFTREELDKRFKRI